MATAPALDLEQPSNIVAIVTANPVMVLTDAKKYDQFYEQMKAECDKHVPDLSTERGRKEIASLAYKVARTKTAIDDAGKKLNEEARLRINAVDESRRRIREQLDELKEEVRRPLTEWEQAEEARVEHCRQTLTLLKDSALVGYEETAEDVRQRIAKVEGMAFDNPKYLDYAPQLFALKASTLSTLQTVADRMDREEAERAELERLRAEAAERERIEAEKAAADEAERQRVEAERQAEERAEAAKQAEQARIAKAEQEAAANARREAEAEAERRLDEERKAREAAEAETKRVTEEQARREREATQAAEARAAEQRGRDNDRAHRGQIMGEAKAALMEVASIEEAVAKTIVLAIVGGNVPHTRITF